MSVLPGPQDEPLVVVYWTYAFDQGTREFWRKLLTSFPSVRFLFCYTTLAYDSDDLTKSIREEARNNPSLQIEWCWIEDYRKDYAHEIVSAVKKLLASG